MEVQTNAGYTCLPHMRNSNLEIRIAGNLILGESGDVWTLLAKDPLNTLDRDLSNGQTCLKVEGLIFLSLSIPQKYNNFFI